MEASPLKQRTVSYQMPRDVLIRVLFRRMAFRPRRLLAMGLLLVAAVCFYFAGHQTRYLSYGVAAGVVFVPWALYRGLVRAVDENPQLTDAKTVRFDSSGVVVIGPNYRSELAWSVFKAFSEDDIYFYLHLANTGFDSVIPKAAFDESQQDDFRQLASVCNASPVAK